LQNSEGAHFLPLLRNFKKESVVLVIGHRLNTEKAKLADSQTPLTEKGVYRGPPESFDNADLDDLFREVPFMPSPKLTELAAHCIKEDLFAYAQLLPYLEPSDSALRRLSGKKTELMVAKVNKSFTMSMVEIDDAEMTRIFNEENQEFEGQLLYSSKLALINQLLRTNNWQDFASAWAGFKLKFDLLLYQPILHSLLNLLEWAIDPLEPSGFQKFFRLERKPLSFPCEDSPKEFVQLRAMDESSLEKLGELMGYIGRYVGFRPRAFIKLCRLFKRVVKEQEESSALVAKVKELTKLCLVPANGYAEGNGPMALELFSYL
jgi:hypothetical protein